MPFICTEMLATNVLLFDFNNVLQKTLKFYEVVQTNWKKTFVRWLGIFSTCSLFLAVTGALGCVLYKHISIV